MKRRPPPGADRAVEVDGPHGWIQWKGTDVCMDIRCACGAVGHIDAEFAYYLKCAECGRFYMVNQSIPLIELREDEIGDIPITACHEFFTEVDE